MARRRKAGYYSRSLGYVGPPASGREWAERFVAVTEKYIEDMTTNYHDHLLNFVRNAEAVDKAAQKVEAWWRSIRAVRAEIRNAVGKAKDRYYRELEAIERKPVVPAP